MTGRAGLTVGSSAAPSRSRGYVAEGLAELSRRTGPPFMSERGPAQAYPSSPLVSVALPLPGPHRIWRATSRQVTLATWLVFSLIVIYGVHCEACLEQVDSQHVYCAGPWSVTA
jgi:hypothetical protein